jgi:biotin transport system ATP-binding protein
MIAFESASHVFAGGTVGIADVTLEIAKGEFVVIAGRNGSGKSVLVRHMNGLLSPTSGRVLFDDVPVRSRPVHVRQNVGMVFQNPDSQTVGQTVEDDVAFGPRNLRLSNDEIAARVETAIDETGLAEHRHARPHTLSAGEKRRLAIAAVLAMRPSVVVFDEPFSNLDYPGVRMVLEEVMRLHCEGKTIVLITHELDRVLAHATRLIVMDRGRIACDGTPERVLGRVEEFGVRRPRATDGGIGELTWLR